MPGSSAQGRAAQIDAQGPRRRPRCSGLNSIAAGLRNEASPWPLGAGACCVDSGPYGWARQRGRVRRRSERRHHLSAAAAIRAAACSTPPPRPPRPRGPPSRTPRCKQVVRIDLDGLRDIACAGSPKAGPMACRWRCRGRPWQQPPDSVGPDSACAPDHRAVIRRNAADGVWCTGSGGSDPVWVELRPRVRRTAGWAGLAGSQRHGIPSRCPAASATGRLTSAGPDSIRPSERAPRASGGAGEGLVYAEDVRKARVGRGAARGWEGAEGCPGRQAAGMGRGEGRPGWGGGAVGGCR